MELVSFAEVAEPIEIRTRFKAPVGPLLNIGFAADFNAGFVTKSIKCVGGVSSFKSDVPPARKCDVLQTRIGSLRR